jgi:hypothetical protein
MSGDHNMNQQYIYTADKDTTYAFRTPPSANIRVSFPDDTTYFQYHSKRVPNRFQRWMIWWCFGVKVEKL